MQTIGGQVASSVRFYTWTNAIQYTFPKFWRLNFSAHLLLNLAFLSPQPVTFTNSTVDNITIQPDDELKLSPGFGIGGDLSIARNVAVNLQISTNLLRIRKSQVFPEGDALQWQGFWKLHLGFAYGF
ncbi:MAG: hypothetical protein ACE5I1_14525 [bacterium]